MTTQEISSSFGEKVQRGIFRPINRHFPAAEVRDDRGGKILREGS